MTVPAPSTQPRPSLASKSRAQRAAMAEVRAGRPRAEVFEAWRAQVSPDKHLAFSIASVADPARIPRGEPFNTLLFGLLVLAAISKAVLALGLFQVSFIRGLLMLALGLLIPVAFAIAVRRHDGQVYPFLILLAGLGAVRSVLEASEYGGWLLLDAAVLVLIAGLAAQVQRRVFPNLNWFAVRKDAQGNYLW
jgi:hypothetical protein